MTITVNGTAVAVSEQTSIAQYLKENRYNVERIAIEYNYDILPKTAYETTYFQENDRLEIVTFVGGG